jgi:hypothetical protein
MNYMHNKIYLNEIEKYQKEIECYILNTECEDENYNSEIWRSNIYLKEKIQNTEKHIKKIKDSNDELEYYTNTSDILFNYYDLIEKQSKKKAN